MNSPLLKDAAARMDQINKMPEGIDKKRANRELVESLWDFAVEVANKQYAPSGLTAAKTIKMFKL